jgi:hypothetical protein
MFSILVRRAIPFAIIAAFLMAAFSPDQAEAWGRRRWWGPGPGVGWYHGPWGGWHDGYWFHGVYGTYAGWWWVVGPTWYYYPAPVYPYPPLDGPPPGYIVQNAPPPPMATAPSASGDVTGPPSSSGAMPAGVKNGTQKAFIYYCASTKGYFPSVKSCAEGWAVSPVKPPP